jgi:hypothetical protein
MYKVFKFDTEIFCFFCLFNEQRKIDFSDHDREFQFCFARRYIEIALTAVFTLICQKILNSTLDDYTSRSEFQVSREKTLPST